MKKRRLGLKIILATQPNGNNVEFLARVVMRTKIYDITAIVRTPRQDPTSVCGLGFRAPAPPASAAVAPPPTAAAAINSGYVKQNVFRQS